MYRIGLTAPDDQIAKVQQQRGRFELNLKGPAAHYSLGQDLIPGSLVSLGTFLDLVSLISLLSEKWIANHPTKTAAEISSCRLTSETEHDAYPSVAALPVRLYHESVMNLSLPTSTDLSRLFFN